MPYRSKQKRSRRRGAVAVEFAFVAPVFIAIMLVTFEASRLIRVQAELTAAAREGARLVSMDRRTLLADGESLNGRVEEEIRTYLDLHRLSGDAATVTIADANDINVPFDLNNSVNDLGYFQIRVELPYSQITSLNLSALENGAVTGQVVFRNARAISN